MKRGSTLFLRIVIYLIGLGVLALCLYLLPILAGQAAKSFPAYVVYSILIGMYAAAIPFFVALHRALRLLSYIDKNQAFSELSVTALKTIKYCALLISALYVIISPFFYLMAEADDAPGFMVIDWVILFASAVIAVFAAVLEKLLYNAIQIKAENDLTV